MYITKSLKIKGITKKHRVHVSSMVSFTLQRSKTEITLRQLKICGNLIQARSIGWVSKWSKLASVFELKRNMKERATWIKCKQHIPYIYCLIWGKEKLKKKRVLNLEWPNGSTVLTLKIIQLAFFVFCSLSILSDTQINLSIKILY